MPVEYKVVKKVTFNKYGSLCDTKYYIKYKAKFLWFWKRWKWVTKEFNGDSAISYYSKKTFNNLPDVEIFCRNVFNKAEYDKQNLTITTPVKRI